MGDSVPGSVGDYAASLGTTGFDYPVTSLINNTPVTLPPSGMFVKPTGVRAADVTDGLSNTLLLGEKHVPTGKDLNAPFDCNTFDGHNIFCSTRSAGPRFPLAAAPTDDRLLFGGPHPGVCMFVFADGGVRPVRNTIDEYALGLLSHRADGQPAPADS